MLKKILVISILFTLMGCAENKIQKQQIDYQEQHSNKPFLDTQKFDKESSGETLFVAGAPLPNTTQIKSKPQAIVAGAPQTNTKRIKSRPQAVVAGAPRPPRQPYPYNTNTTQFECKPQAIEKRTTQKVTEEIVAKKINPAFKKNRQRLITEDTLRKQIAQLSEKIRYSEQRQIIKMRFVGSVNTHKHVVAQYVKNWEHKVEQTGNLNFSNLLESIKQKGFGNLRTDVAINADGTICSIRISQSSGVKSIDKAAMRIIKLSAPFTALPKELLNELDVLVITRDWRFSEEMPNNFKTPDNTHWWMFWK